MSGRRHPNYKKADHLPGYGTWIKEQRLARGWSQMTLASRLVPPVDQTTISSWEREDGAAILTKTHLDQLRWTFKAEAAPRFLAEVLTIDEVARLLRCSSSHVRRMIERGLPYLRVGDLIRFERSAIMDHCRAAARKEGS